MVLAFFSFKRKDNTVSKQLLKEIKQQERVEKHEHFMSLLYKILSKIPFVGRYVKYTEHMFSTICPYEEIYLERLATSTSLISFLIATIASFVIIIGNYIITKEIGTFPIACSLFASYIAGKEVLQKRVSIIEKKLMRELDRYISGVKHIYSYKKNIQKAIIEASDGMSYELKLHAKKISEILSRADRDERVKEYTESVRGNKFLKMFVSQVYEVSKRGNTKDKNDESLFAKNMERLRIEILKSVYKKEKRAHKLSGYTFIAVTPLFFMKLFEKWALDFSDKMVPFYASSGKIIIAITFVATIIVYSLTSKAREATLGLNIYNFNFLNRIIPKELERRITEKTKDNTEGFSYNLKKRLITCGENTSTGGFIIRMFISGIAIFVVSLTFIGTLHSQEKERILTDRTRFDTVVTTSNQMQKEKIIDTSLEITKKYCDKRISQEEITMLFKQDVKLLNNAMISAIVDEIHNGIIQYQKQTLHWGEYLAAVLIGITSMFIPYASLNYRYSLFLNGKDDEVRQFQTIILIERHFPTITVMGILKKMEAFAVTFRPALQDCINSYLTGPQEALTKLKEDEGDHPLFSEFVDGLIDSTHVGIKTAFDEIENSGMLFEQSKELQEEIGLEKKRDNTAFISYIPVALAVGVFFIAPFFISVFSEAGNIFAVIDALDELI